MNFLKDILLQLFFLFLPLVLYYSLWHRRIHKPSAFRRQIAASFYCTSSVILCLHFPISLTGGATYNLSLLAVIIAVLYGGYLAGLLTFSVLLFYPFLIGMPIHYVYTFLVVPLLMLLPAAIQPRWKNLSLNKKYALALATTLINFSLLYASAFVTYNRGTSGLSLHQELVAATMSAFIFLVSMMIIVYLVEYFCGLDHLHNQLKKMRKLHHINHLADEVSHEVHRPLTVAKGFTQLLGAEQNHTNQEYVPIILKELNRAEKIINSYIKLAKAETFPSKAISSRELVEDVMESLQTYARNTNVELQLSKNHNLRLRGNMELLSESIISILKFCMDSHDGSLRSIQIHHYLKSSDAIFEIIIKEGRLAKPQIDVLHNLPAFVDQEEHPSLHAASTILLAHGGDIYFKDAFFKKSAIVLVLPAYLKKKSSIRPQIVSAETKA